jgi:hypothetical protein
MFFILEKQEIPAEFFFLNPVWGFSVVLRQLAHRREIGFLRPDRKTAQLHILEHLLS